MESGRPADRRSLMMRTAPSQHPAVDERTHYLRRVLLVLAPALLLIVGSMLLVRHLRGLEVERDLSLVCVREVESLHRTLHSFLLEAAADTAGIAGSRSLQDLFDTRASGPLNDLGEELIVFLSTHPDVHRLCLLDRRGHEMVRVARNNGRAVIEEPAGDKTPQELFPTRKLSQLEAGAVLITPLMPRREPGATPLPVFHIATAVCRGHDSPLGYLVMTLRAEDLLGLMNRQFAPGHGDLFLLDADERVLIGPGMEPFSNTRGSPRFGALYGEAWNSQASEPDGIARTEEGVFVHRTLDLRAPTDGDSGLRLQEPPVMTLVGVLPRPLLQEHLRGLDRTLLTSGALLLLLALLGSHLLAHGSLQRHRALLALGESEQRFRSSFDSAAVGMALVSPLGQILDVNNALCSLLGYRPEELLHRTSQDITFEEDRAIDAEVRQRMLKGEQDTFQREKRFLHCSGGLVWGHLSIALVRNERAEPLYFIAQVQDMSEQKHLQQQLLQAQKMESIGRLAGGIAHDFNNLLQAILGFTEVVLGDLPEGDPHRPDLTEIQRAATRAAKLTAQMLAFSRQQVIKPRATDLHQLVDNMARLLHRVIGEHIRLELEFAPGSARVNVDPAQIEQVLMNLAVNARDAMPQGGRLSISTRFVTLSPRDAAAIDNARPGEFFCLAVTDTGTGIPPAVQRRLFEPFFTTKGPGRGTGLGLSVVYGIVNQHDGWMQVYSQVGIGTTFKVYLPRLPDSPETEAPAQESLAVPGPGGRGARMLLVEDEDGVRDLMARELSGHGYHVTVAADAEEAERIFEEQQGNVDILFSDVVLPGSHGLELAARLTSRKPSLHVLMTSGYADQLARWPEIKDQGFAFLQKPYMLAELLQTLAGLSPASRR